MRFIITTVLGNFDVEMPYSPSSGDLTLNRLTATVNKFATQPLLVVADKYPELDTIKDSEKIANLAIKLVDEAQLEKALYDSTRVCYGAGIPLQLSLKKRYIELRNW